MILCEFCLQFQDDGQCSSGLRIPTRMSCREFDPGVEKFCSNPSDFTGVRQIIQMATYFGIKGNELKKVKVIAAREEQARATPRAQADSAGTDGRYENEEAVKSFDADGVSKTNL